MEVASFPPRRLAVGFRKTDQAMTATAREVVGLGRRRMAMREVVTTPERERAALPFPRQPMVEHDRGNDGEAATSTEQGHD